MNTGDFSHWIPCYAWEAGSRLFVEGDGRDFRLAVNILYNHTPGLAADLTIFNVFLTIAAARIHANFVGLAAVWANHFTGRVRGAVAEGEIAIELRFFVGIGLV
jgi:hypothetical protein